MKKKFILLPVILLFVTIILSLPCDKYLTCDGKMMETLAYPGQWFVLLVPLSIFALTLTNQKHKFWLKFSGIFFSISMVIVFMTPEYGSGIVSVDRELTNWFFAGLYAFISFIYFVVQFFKRRRDKTLPIIVK